MAVHYHAAEGQPIISYIIRSLGLRSKQFAEKLMTCSNTWARNTKCSKALDTYTGQKFHITRTLCRQQHMQAMHQVIRGAAIGNEKHAEYDTDVHRPARLRVS